MERYSSRLDPTIIGKRFPTFEEELCNEISEVGEWVALEEGDAILNEDRYIKSFPLLLDGVLRISRMDSEGREALLYYLTSGQVCSMALTCCMEQTKSNISAMAEMDSDILRIPIKYLDIWMIKYPSWKVFVMHSYKQRFDELLETVDNLAFKKMDERLLQFFADYNNSTKKSYFIGTHEDIAKALTTSREVISRLLKVLEKSGKIKLSRNRVDLLFLA